MEFNMNYKEAKEIIDNIIDSAYLNARDINSEEAKKIDEAKNIFLKFEKPSLEEMEYIKDALQDNASDMTVYDLFDSVHIDESNKHLFPHSDPESGDKDVLEKIYVEQCFETYKEMSRAELLEDGILQEIEE